jgi:transketolase
MALERSDGPTAIVLTRQNLAVIEKRDDRWSEKCRKGAYAALDCDGNPDVVIVATGSEVEPAIQAAGRSGKKVRVVSMISRELFQSQDQPFRKSLIPDGVRVITAEAGVGIGWNGIASSREDIFSIDRFGESGKGNEVAEALGFSVSDLAKLIG